MEEKCVSRAATNPLGDFVARYISIIKCRGSLKMRLSLSKIGYEKRPMVYRGFS